jgi:hypothetical protein
MKYFLRNQYFCIILGIWRKRIQFQIFFFFFFTFSFFVACFEILFLCSLWMYSTIYIVLYISKFWRRSMCGDGECFLFLKVISSWEILDEVAYKQAKYPFRKEDRVCECEWKYIAKRNRFLLKRETSKTKKYFYLYFPRTFVFNLTKKTKFNFTFEMSFLCHMKILISIFVSTE